MSTTDRIPVPSNGHHTLPGGAAEDAAASDGAAGVAPGAEDPIDDATNAPRVIVTPGQATVVGFGIIAGLILLLLGRRRGRR